MLLCLVYNTTGEPIELVPSLMGLVLHLRGKAVILETVPGRFARSPRLSLPAAGKRSAATAPANRVTRGGPDQRAPVPAGRAPVRVLRAASPGAWCTGATDP